jgi:hemerythrin-like domain-containing protein
MKTDITRVLMEEHQLILRMIDLLEHNSAHMERGNFSEWKFFADALDFIRTFADRHHHAKEEDVLFHALVENGMPAQRSPIEAMHIEHEQGRAHVRGMDIALQQIRAGETEQTQSLAQHARAYAELLREHIEKEDTILYPLAERVLPQNMRPEIVEGYAQADTHAPKVAQTYRAMVEHYEAARSAAA